MTHQSIFPTKAQLIVISVTTSIAAAIYIADYLQLKRQERYVQNRVDEQMGKVDETLNSLRTVPKYDH